MKAAQRLKKSSGERDSVLDCGSPLPLSIVRVLSKKRQRAGAVQNLAAVRSAILFLALALAPVVRAQQTPHVAYVYPAGGQVGTTFQIVVGGQFLSGITNFEVILDGGLASAKIIGYNRQLKPDEQQALKDELTKFQNKQKTGVRLTAQELATVNEIRQTLTQFGRRPANPAIGEFMTLQLALATNAAPGDHEIRVRTPGGLSNPLKFCVGVLPEATKPDWKAVPKDRGSLDPAVPLPVDAAVKLPVTINGQIAPGGVDRYRFAARKGQQLVISAAARALIPYLADAVPGWFEATLTIYNARGNALAYDERYHFRPDPVVHFEVPQDGDYIVEIHDSIFRGREDFVYRLTIGELPFVTGIFPLGGRLGEKTTVALTGWNLPEKELTLDNSAAEPGVHFAWRKIFQFDFVRRGRFAGNFRGRIESFRRNRASRELAGHCQRARWQARREGDFQI